MCAVMLTAIEAAVIEYNGRTAVDRVGRGSAPLVRDEEVRQ
jgi:hypothetical protein